ncbi:MAG: hypothetical protein R3316_05890, partial [Rhodovibrionaceae bacterium]|nr:hypothetical protein [Rhodovibrionaceae bacterium]
MQPKWVSRLGNSAARKLARPNRRRALAIFGATLLAVSCAQPPSNTTHGESAPGGDYAAFDATRVFSAGYKDIDEIYIENVETAD